MDPEPDETVAQMFHRQHEKKEQKLTEATEVVMDAQRLRIEAEAAVRTRERTQEAWENVCKALGTDPATVKEMNKSGAKRGFVNLAYLVVILGCEIDLYGFGMAFLGYWNLKDQEFVKIMCLVGPLGYLLGAGMYMYYNSAAADAEKEKLTEKEETESESVSLTLVDPMAAKPETECRPKTVPRNAKQPIRIRYYHFIPVYRFYLVVKDKEVDDIEGIFRVNSLSSFSLGMAQICGVIFFGLENEWKMDLLTCINMGSQFVNWCLTFIYFMTPISAKMGAAMKVETLIYNSSARLREKFEMYDHLLRKNSSMNTAMPSESPQNKLKEYEKSLDREIEILGNLKDMDLTPFDVYDKLDALKFLYRRMNNVYARI